MTQEQRNLLEEATRRYEQSLAGALAYLAGRGIGPEVAKQFRLGYVDEAVVGDGRCVGRLAIPYRTPAGVVDIRFRAIDDAEPKYLGTGGSTTRLFNAIDLHTAGNVIALCEGELDTVVMSGLVGVPAVGIAGVSNYKKHFAHCLADYERVLVVMDADDAGHRAADKLRKEIPNGVVVTPPRDMDINDWVNAEGPDAIREALGLG